MAAMQALPCLSARCSPRTTGARLPKAAAPSRAAAAPRGMRVVVAAAPMLTPREKRKIWGPLDGGPKPIPEPEADRNEWPFPNFIKRTLEKFPDAGVCTVDEARVLNHEGGYDFLDVRTETEHEYRIAYSVNVPIITGQWRFNTEAKCKLPQQAVNADFVAQVSTVFAKDAKIIVVCSDGRVRCLGALQALDEAGFTNLVGMRGGYNGFSRVFDSKFARRVDPDAMKEVESRDFPDQSTGIFGTGAGYDRVDTVAWVPVGDPIKWLSYQEEMAKLAK